MKKLRIASFRLHVLTVVAITLQACAALPGPSSQFDPPQLSSELPQAVRYALATFAARSRADDDYADAWIAAAQMVALDSHPKAYKLLVELTNSERFKALTPERQHAGLLLTGLVGLEQRDYSYAHRILTHASVMPQAGSADWEGRLISASNIGDELDEMTSLTKLVKPWPSMLEDLSPGPIRSLVRKRPESDEINEARYQLLNALFDASWKVEETEPQVEWHLLIEECVARNDFDRASKVIMRINDAHILLSMKVDRRYDALVKLKPANFDLASAVDRQIAEYMRSQEKHPRSLDAVVQLTYVYLDAGRFSDVMTVTNAVIERVTLGGDLKSIYDDGPAKLQWIYDNRARALVALQRDAEAEMEIRGAAERLENGKPNVSNVINLADFLLDRGRAEEARMVLASIPEGPGYLSQYGKMQQQEALLRVSVMLKDVSVTERCLSYLREHGNEAPETLQFAFFRAGKTDEAAQLLIRRLEDPIDRQEALLEVQEYAPREEPELVQEENRRRGEWLKRPDIQAEIAKVGRREKVALPRGLL